MREDMAKVIVERPRIKPWSTREGRRIDPEDLPAHEGMRRGHVLRGERKQLNENLAPLRRYLAKQVGRPWSKVYSEISAHLRADNTVQQHVRDHLHDFVAIKPRRNMAGWRHSSLTGLWWQPFYVHPVTGLLCRTDRLPRKRRASAGSGTGKRRPPNGSYLVAIVSSAGSMASGTRSAWLRFRNRPTGQLRSV